MELLTKELEKRLPAFYEQKGKDAIVFAKFFTPDSSWTWYVTEYNPAERLFFGYVIGLDNEFGYFSLDELESARGPLGLPVERDLYFIPKPLSEIVKTL